MKAVFKYLWFILEFENRNKMGPKNKSTFNIHIKRQKIRLKVYTVASLIFSSYIDMLTRSQGKLSCSFE